MPRVSRNKVGANYYHIMTQGIGKEYIFNTHQDKKKIIKVLKKYFVGDEVTIYAYCIMDNHLHLLVKSLNDEQLSTIMLKVNTSYAIYYNREHKRVGFVFRDRFRAEPVYDSYQMQNCVKYIHDNPLKAQIINDLNNYPYSSYNDYVNGNVSSDIINDIYGKEEYFDKLSGYQEECDFIETDNEFGNNKMENFEDVCAEYEGLDYRYSNNVKNISEDIRKRCGVDHSKIYTFMGIPRSTYFRKIKN